MGQTAIRFPADNIPKIPVSSTRFQLLERKRHNFIFALALVVFLFAWACTGAHFMADTSIYASAILNYQHGLPSDDYHRLTSNPFWEFGHLLWRPTGWTVFVIAKPLIKWFHGNERVQVIWSLMAVDFLAAVTSVIFFFLLVKKLTENEWAALLATLLLAFSDAFLNYSHTGSAYPVGLAFLVVGMYFWICASVQTISWPKTCLAGASFATAVLFWFPYILVLPAGFVFPLVFFGWRWRRRLQATGVCLAVCALLGLIAYSIVIRFVGIHSTPDLRAWVLAAGHGQVQPGGIRAIARLAFSLPRSFINMGQDGILLKRFVVHDPYASVTLADLLRLSFWKPVLFYTSLVVTCVALLRFEQGRDALFILIIAVIPVIFFSLFVFEAGSIERYLPIYPFIFLAWVYALVNVKTRPYSKILLLSFLIASAAVNLNAMRRSTLDRQKEAALNRIRDLAPVLKPTSLVLTVNEQDNLAVFCHEFPLDPLNSEYDWQYYDVLEINAVRLSTWREDLASRVLWSWRQGGSVWLPLRFLRQKPQPNWYWVEGDDTRVHWSDLPTFFSKFDLGPTVGGQDGFASLPDIPSNRRIMIALTQEDHKFSSTGNRSMQHLASR